MADAVTFTEILQAVVDTAREATGAKVSYLGPPSQKPEHPHAVWVDLAGLTGIARNHSSRGTDSRLAKSGVEHVINATVYVTVGYVALGPAELEALAQTAQDLMNGFEADETLRGTGDEDLVAKCTLGAITVFRQQWDEETTVAGVQAPVTIRKLH